MVSKKTPLQEEKKRERGRKVKAAKLCVRRLPVFLSFLVTHQYPVPIAGHPAPCCMTEWLLSLRMPCGIPSHLICLLISQWKGNCQVEKYALVP